MAQPKYGTQPTASGSVTRRGRGGGPGNHPSRGRGGARKIPNTGAFKGKAGEALSNQDPQGFVDNMLTLGGWFTGTGTPADQYARQILAPQLMSDYGAARNAHQKLSVRDWFQNQYGAGPAGKGGALQPGRLAFGGQEDPRFQHFYSNMFQDQYLQGEAGRLGLTDATGSNAGYNDFVTNYLGSTIKPRFEQARAVPGQGQLNMDDWLKTQDWLNQARSAFATRGNSQRQPGITDQAGRWSWWA